MKLVSPLHWPALLVLLCCTTAAHAVDYVSVSESSAILYDAPSLKAKKLFVVNRHMPFEQVVTLEPPFWAAVQFEEVPQNV